MRSLRVWVEPNVYDIVRIEVFIELEVSYLDQLLLYACEFGYLKLVQYLLEEGANAAPTSRTISGHRCIMLQHKDTWN